MLLCPCSDREGQSSQALARPRTGCPAFGGGTAAVDSKALTATASIPPWLRRFQDPVPTPASCGGTTLQVIRAHIYVHNTHAAPFQGCFVVLKISIFAAAV